MNKERGGFWSPIWIFTTVLVLAALAVLIWLGFWQLDRAAQRKTFNERIRAQIDQPVLDLNQETQADLPGMEYREVVARGEFSNDEAIGLRNQIHGGLPGFHLLVPLRLEGTDQAVLVNRGWIPLEDDQPADWEKYRVSGSVTVHGVMRRSTPPGRFGLIDPPMAAGETGRDFWNRATLERIAPQMSQPLLPVWVQELPAEGDDTIPAAAALELDLSDGPHFGYAVQWFAFAAVLAAGYPAYVRRSLRDATRAKKSGEGLRIDG